MKKDSILLFGLIFSLSGGGTFPLFAQIPNASFENWTSGTPDGWTVTSNPPGTTVTRSNNGWQDTGALRLNVVSLGAGYTAGGAAKSGGKSGYFSNTGNFITLTGWYILHMADTADQLYISAGTKCSNSMDNSSGIRSYFMDSNTAVYKEFIMPMNYDNGCTADSATITFELANFSTYKPDTNSYAIIDGLSLGAVSGVPAINNRVTLEEAYPNPASVQCNIIYSIPGNSTVNAGLYDISGRSVAALLNNTRQTTGKYRIPFDVSRLANGVYILRISMNGAIYSQRVIVERN